MSWIVIGQSKGLIELKSRKSEGSQDGILTVGSFLTVENEDSKVILRVEETHQVDPFGPTPLVVEMDIGGLEQDVKCYNKILARRLKHISKRDDGKYDFIPARSEVRLSNEDEIKIALNTADNGPTIFPATLFSGENNLIQTDNKGFVNIHLNEEMYWHQTVILGKTGSGKTVAIKHLAEHFVNNMEEVGCVIALNVKGADLLHMEKPTNKTTDKIFKEWDAIDLQPKGINNFVIYSPSGSEDPRERYKNIGATTERITLQTSEIDPEAMLGLLREQMTDIAARWFPDIFRRWQEDNPNGIFKEFLEYFDAQGNDFDIQDVNGVRRNESLPGGSVGVIRRAITYASRFFDGDATPVNVSDFLEPGKFSSIDLSGTNAIDFGSVFLRHILAKILEAKQREEYDLPVLIIIDEAHKFHKKGQATSEALKYLDEICRTGRETKVSVMFASQDSSTIPSGILDIVNTHIVFRNSNKPTASRMNVTLEEMKSLEDGYAVADIYGVRNLKYIKFPMAVSGVIR